MEVTRQVGDATRGPTPRSTQRVSRKAANRMLRQSEASSSPLRHRLSVIANDVIGRSSLRPSNRYR